MKTLTIIGGSLGTKQALTGEAVDAIQNATRIYTTQRLAQAMHELQPLIHSAPYHDIRNCLAEDTSQDAAVIVSGDTGFFSLAKTLQDTLGSSYQIRLLPGISSMQAMCARLGVSYENLKVVSTHGRMVSVAGPVSYNNRVLVLTGGGEDARKILQCLCAFGLGKVRVHAGQNLGLADECLCTGTAEMLAEKEFASLTVLLIENDKPVPVSGRLRDDDFVREKVPMTKEAVRCLAVDRLEIKANDTVYDIGAGSGSVSVAMARKACDGMVYAIERGAEACSLIERNRDKMGTHNIKVIAGSAPLELEALPAPDKVFIGGSGGRMIEILDALLAKGSFDLCVSAITLESISEAVNAMQEKGFAEVEVECINLAKSKNVGHYHMMIAQNPVYLISGRWIKSKY